MSDLLLLSYPTPPCPPTAAPACSNSAARNTRPTGWTSFPPSRPVRPHGRPAECDPDLSAVTHLSPRAADPGPSDPGPKLAPRGRRCSSNWHCAASPSLKLLVRDEVDGEPERPCATNAKPTTPPAWPTGMRPTTFGYRGPAGTESQCCFAGKSRLTPAPPSNSLSAERAISSAVPYIGVGYRADGFSLSADLGARSGLVASSAPRATAETPYPRKPCLSGSRRQVAS